MELKDLNETAIQRCHLTQAAPLLVGVSGGPDSLCLLDGLARLGFNLVVAHFDHHLRPESGADAAKVRAAAEARGLAFILGEGDVAAYARAERLSLEEAARDLRYRFLFEQARCHSTQAVAVGHTADDQVETVLMHLLRGAGLNGLSGMPFRTLLPDWDARILLVRPLLPFWRAEILAYCQEHGLDPVIDRTNEDTAFFRNRLRRELIPLLESYNPRLRKNLWNTAQSLAGDEAIVQSAVQAAFASCAAGQGEGWVALQRRGFLALSTGLQRGVLRHAVSMLLSPSASAKASALAEDSAEASAEDSNPAYPLTSSPRDIDFAAVERALSYATGGSDATTGQVDLVHGLFLSVEGDRLLVRQGDIPPDSAWPRLDAVELPVPVTGEVDLSPGWRLVTAWLSPVDLPDFSAREGVAENAFSAEAWLDADALPGSLSLRRPRPGDRFQPLGLDGHSIKLSDFWINVKLPRRARPAWPLLVSGEAIVWIPGCRLAHPYRVRPDTRRVLHLALKRTIPSDY